MSLNCLLVLSISGLGSYLQKLVEFSLENSKGKMPYLCNAAEWQKIYI